MAGKVGGSPRRRGSRRCCAAPAAATPHREPVVWAATARQPPPSCRRTAVPRGCPRSWRLSPPSTSPIPSTMPPLTRCWAVLTEGRRRRRERRQWRPQPRRPCRGRSVGDRLARAPHRALVPLLGPHPSQVHGFRPARPDRQLPAAGLVGRNRCPAGRAASPHLRAGGGLSQKTPLPADAATAALPPRRPPSTPSTGHMAGADADAADAAAAPSPRRRGCE